MPFAVGVDGEQVMPHHTHTPHECRCHRDCWLACCENCL